MNSFPNDVLTATLGTLAHYKVQNPDFFFIRALPSPAALAVLNTTPSSFHQNPMVPPKILQYSGESEADSAQIYNKQKASGTLLAMSYIFQSLRNPFSHLFCTLLLILRQDFRRDKEWLSRWKHLVSQASWVPSPTHKSGWGKPTPQSCPLTFYTCAVIHEPIHARAFARARTHTHTRYFKDFWNINYQIINNLHWFQGN